MSLGFYAMISCGPACWEAKGGVCKCSCGGANHGFAIRHGTDSQIKLNRQKVYEGYIWELGLVDSPVMDPRWEGYSRSDGQAERRAQEINKEKGIKYRYAHTSRQHFGEFPFAIIRCASQSQIEKWPELAAWKNIRITPTAMRPYIMWIRNDELTNKVKEQMAKQNEGTGS